MSSGEWILIVASLMAIAGIAYLWRASEARAAQLSAANGKLESEREDLKVRLARESQARKKQADELAIHRKRADKIKKRETRTSPEQPLGTASRIADLESELGRALRERNQSQLEREQLASQIAKLEARIEVSARAAEVARATPVVTVEPPADPDQEALAAQLAERTERLGKLESELDEAKIAASRMRKRMSNQEQLYASVRAELDVKKDRLRTQEEQIQRLQALKASVSE